MAPSAKAHVLASWRFDPSHVPRAWREIRSPSFSGAVRGPTGAILARMRAASGTIFALLLAMLCAGPALAQSTGGSFGGGGFNRPDPAPTTGSTGSSPTWGGSSSGNSGQWPSTPPEATTPTTPGSSSGSGGGIGLGGLCCLLAFAGVIGLFFVLRGKKGGGGPANLSGSPGAGGPPMYTGPNAMHVSQLSLGVDWRARKALQETLTRLAQSGNTGTPQGLANLLRETVLALRRAELSWLYVSSKTLGPISQQNAEAQFQQLATSARAAFQHELVRGAGGQAATTQAAPELRAHSNEGEGTVVVHLIIATYRPIHALPSPDANQIRAALDNRAALTADQLGALEVVWSPAAESDRMSTAELEQFYPDMRLIDPNSIAGRIFCSFCRGPFAMELLSCPHCGAPAEQSKDNRSPR